MKSGSWGVQHLVMLGSMPRRCGLQVYRGRLKSGEAVAVKVQRPFILETVTVDLFVLRRVFVLLRRFNIPTDFVALLDEWALRFFEELDYVHEVHPRAWGPASGACAWELRACLARSLHVRRAPAAAADVQCWRAALVQRWHLSACMCSV